MQGKHQYISVCKGDCSVQNKHIKLDKKFILIQKIFMLGKVCFSRFLTSSMFNIVKKKWGNVKKKMRCRETKNMREKKSVNEGDFDVQIEKNITDTTHTHNMYNSHHSNFVSAPESWNKSPLNYRDLPPSAPVTRLTRLYLLRRTQITINIRTDRQGRTTTAVIKSSS